MFLSHACSISLPCVMLAGQNFLGTVFVSPSRPSQHPHKTDLSRAWQYEWSYKSWHQPTLPGMVLPAHTTLPALPRRRRKTDQDSSSATVEKHRIKSDVDWWHCSWSIHDIEWNLHCCCCGALIWCQSSTMVDTTETLWNDWCEMYTSLPIHISTNTTSVLTTTMCYSVSQTWLGR